MSLETSLLALAQSVGLDIKAILAALIGKAEKITLKPGDIVYGGPDGEPTLLPIGALDQTLTIHPSNVLSWQNRLAGAAGAAGTLVINSFTMGEPGSQAAVTNTGTPSAAVLDIVIPRVDASVAVANALLIAPTERSVLVATAAFGTLNIDAGLCSLYQYIILPSTSDFVLNIRSTSTQSLNDLLEVGDVKVPVIIVLNGNNGYRATAVKIDGVLISNPAIFWAGKGAPTVGTANGKDSYSLGITKTGNNMWQIVANQTVYG